MSVSLSPSEKVDLHEKRQDLFLIWSGSGGSQIQPASLQPEPQSASALQPQVLQAPDEVQRLIHHISDPTADKMFLR